MTQTSEAEVRKPKFVSRGEKPLPSGGGSSQNTFSSSYSSTCEAEKYIKGLIS